MILLRNGLPEAQLEIKYECVAGKDGAFNCAARRVWKRFNNAERSGAKKRFQIHLFCPERRAAKIDTDINKFERIGEEMNTAV